VACTSKKANDLAQIAADEDHLESKQATQHASFPMNVWGRRYSDDGPLHDVLPDKDNGGVLRQGIMNHTENISTPRV
jgi:hypothetical protein